MSYRLNKTDGELVVELADGQIDDTSTDITLVGRNYRGFGELFNENFIKITENFANTNPPGSPLKGQLWYDTAQERLKIYNGSAFRAAGSPIVSATRPSLVQGDLWIDNVNRKLYFYDGNSDNEFTLVGPAYDDAQGKTGLEVESVIDIFGRGRVIIKILVAGDLFGVITKESFRLAGNNKITGYPDDPDDTIFPARQIFEKGINLVDPDFFYRGTASSALSLKDTEGNIQTATDFLIANQDEETTGSLFIKNSQGLTIGVQDTEYATFKISGTTTVIENQEKQTDIALRTKVGNQFKNAVFIDGSEDKVGIYNVSPQAELDVNGDVIIGGDLLVKGDTSYFNVQTLQVLDKNIELGLLDDSTQGDDSVVDGGGLTLRSSQGSKDLFWDLNDDSWTSNVNFNLLSQNSYKINGQKVLSSTELGPTVTKANGLTSIGTLTSLNVDNVSVDGNNISTTSGNLVLNPASDISVSNSKITDASEPTNAQDVATKNYVDTQIDSTDVALSFDITGLDSPDISNPYVDVGEILESISPANQKKDGTIARIHAVAYNSAQVDNIDIASAADKQFTTINNIEDPFDLEENLTAESVIQDINFSTASGTYTANPTRSTFIFEIINSQWSWVNTV